MLQTPEPRSDLTKAGRRRRYIRCTRIAGRRTPIEWIRVAGDRSRGILFSPPLIGGRAAQQVRLFRPLIRKGFDLLTFSYSGHGDSAGRFSLSSSIRDTCQMLDHAVGLACREGVSLHGVGSSYSAVPLLHCAGRRKEPFESLILINPLPRIRAAAVARSYLLFRHRTKREADAGNGPVGGSVDRFLNRLFPSIWTDWRRFGTLERGRTRPLRIVVESLFVDPLCGVAVRETPVLCLYGLRDEVLRLFHPNLAEDFRPLIRKICPKVRFQSLPGGHFLRSKRIRSMVFDSMIPFLAGASGRNASGPLFYNLPTNHICR